jgi:type II secretory pathway component GspD/PulD (secretin)
LEIARSQRRAGDIERRRMKTRAVVLVAILICGFALAQGQESIPELPVPGPETDADTVSMIFDDVPLEDVINMFVRITEVEIVFDPGKMRGLTVSVKADNRPWKVVMESILAEHGFVLVEKPEGSEMYSVVTARELNLQELSGVLRKDITALSPYRLELDGAAALVNLRGVTESIYLRGDDLKDVPDGTRIRVKGKIKSILLDSSVVSRESPFPTHWHIFMVVEGWTKISKPFEKTEK